MSHLSPAFYGAAWYGGHHGDHSDEPLGALLDEHLARARARVEAHIADLLALRRRIREFQAARATASAPLSGPAALARLLASDPRRAAADTVESAP